MFTNEQISRASRDTIAMLVVENKLLVERINQLEAQLRREAVEDLVLPQVGGEPSGNGGPGSPHSDLPVHQSGDGTELRDELEPERRAGGD